MDARVVVALGAIAATVFWMRRLKKHLGTAPGDKVTNQEMQQASAQSSKQRRAALVVKTDPISTVPGLPMLADLQLLIVAPFDLPSLGSLAACSSKMRENIEAPQFWQHHFDALGVTVRAHLDLGIPSGPDIPQRQGNEFPPGCRVRLDGLTNTDYNGLLGTVLPEHVESGRVPVQLETPESKRVLLKPANLSLIDVAEKDAKFTHPKSLLRQARNAASANEAFYEAFRGGHKSRMRSLWLNEIGLKPNAIAQLLGASRSALPLSSAYTVNRDTYLPQIHRGDNGEKLVYGTRCVHPNQGLGLLLGHETISRSWDQILSSRFRPMDIRPSSCQWELDGHGRARVSLNEQIEPGISTRATNAYVSLNGAWHMVAHVAS